MWMVAERFLIVGSGTTESAERYFSGEKEGERSGGVKV